MHIQQHEYTQTQTRRHTNIETGIQTDRDDSNKPYFSASDIKISTVNGRIHWHFWPSLPPLPSSPILSCLLPVTGMRDGPAATPSLINLRDGEMDLTSA